MRFLAASGVVLLMVSSSCTGQEASPPTLVAERCLMPVGVPDFYRVVGSEDVEQGATIGVRTFLSGPHGKSLVYTAGVLMDFFEEAPSGTIELTAGKEGSLFRDGRVRWVLFWYQDDACKMYSIGGDGFSRVEFLDLMRELGRLPESSP